MKVKKENNRRLEILYTQSHNWLTAVAFNLCKNKEVAEDLVGELYIYLAEKCNPSLWYLNSFNLMYCHSFLSSRFINRYKVQSRYSQLADDYDNTDTEYDIDKDILIEKTHNEVVAELKRMEYTKQWAPSKLTQLYFFNEDMTLEKLASEIKISKSTAFLNVKRTKKHLRETIPNPFKRQD